MILDEVVDDFAPGGGMPGASGGGMGNAGAKGQGVKRPQTPADGGGMIGPSSKRRKGKTKLIHFVKIIEK